jgi:hypothetical protein
MIVKLTHTQLQQIHCIGEKSSSNTIRIIEDAGKSGVLQKSYLRPKANYYWENMPIYSLNQRLKIALGGFTSFTGVIILICIVLALTNTADLSVALQGANLAFIITIVGVLDIACGLILFLGRKEIIFSFASNQKKTGHNAD